MPRHLISGALTKPIIQTLSGGSLGSWVEEGRGKMRCLKAPATLLALFLRQVERTLRRLIPPSGTRCSFKPSFIEERRGSCHSRSSAAQLVLRAKPANDSPCVRGWVGGGRCA